MCAYVGNVSGVDWLICKTWLICPQSPLVIHMWTRILQILPIFLVVVDHYNSVEDLTWHTKVIASMAFNQLS